MENLWTGRTVLSQSHGLNAPGVEDEPRLADFSQGSLDNWTPPHPASLKSLIGPPISIVFTLVLDIGNSYCQRNFNYK